MATDDEVFFGGFISGACLVCLVYVVLKLVWSYQRVQAQRALRDTPIELQELTPRPEYILKLVVRTDIPLVKTKLAKHCSHASVTAFDALLKKDPQAARHWQSTGQIKVIVAADSVHVINRLDDLARKLDIISTFVCDDQPSLVGPSPVTVLGIGPGPQNVISQITRNLGLL